MGELVIQGVSAAEGAEVGSSDAYAGAVRSCAQRGVAVVDYGTCCAGLGHPPPRGCVRITPPAGVLAHYVSDLTVTVAGGTTLGDLQAALAEHGQFLPIDGVPPTATIGEIIAHNLYGPLRQGYGGMRELLLGLKVVDGEGRLLTVGGRTVKNVSGYDVTRLMVGNLNTLGLIAEATLRTAARPAEVTAVRITGVEPWHLDGRLTSLLSSDAEPVHLATETRAEPRRDPSHTVTLGYVGSATGREAQWEALRVWLADHFRDAAPMREDLSFEADEQQRQQGRAWQDEARAWLKLIVPPAMTGQILRKLLQWHEPGVRVQTLPSWGILHVGLELPPAPALNQAEDPAADALRDLDRRLVNTVKAVGGMRLWMRRPANVSDLPPFAPAQPDWPVLKRLRGVFDPHDVLNPGRFP